MNVSLLLWRDHESQELTRGRPARAGADARIEESVAIGEVRLAILPYGRRYKRVFFVRLRITSNRARSRGGEEGDVPLQTPAFPPHR